MLTRARTTIGGRHHLARQTSSLSASISTSSDDSDMPPERQRVSNAQGRQKSCSECVKSKRKCGLEQPSCARCRKQRLTCAYPLPPCADGGPQQNGLLDFDDTDLALDMLPHDDLEPLHFDFDAPNISSTSSTEVLDFDFAAGADSLESLSAMLNGTSNPGENMVLQKSCSTTKVLLPATLSWFAKSRVEYTIEQLKTVPRMMVEQNGAPWAHKMLYEERLPRSLQDAQAACALFISLNDVNLERVAEFITSRAEELTTSQMPQDPGGILARAQALLLYHIMLVFGGNMRLLKHADALAPSLEAVGGLLLNIAAQQVDPTAQLPVYPATTARSAWRSYVFRESVRRTLLSLFHISAITSLVQGQLQACSHDLQFGNKVTVSAHLWNATDAFEFAVAWNTKKHFLVKELDFTEVLKDAGPGDVDLFSKMILVGLRGLDDVRGWFYMKGAVM